MRKKTKKVKRLFEQFSNAVTHITGSSTAFIVALVLIILWAVSGPVFHFSDTWQLVINTGTTIITFLMVFIIQQSQNKDSMALQLKLNELIAANKATSNRLIDAEGLTEDELKILKDFYVKLSEQEKNEKDLRVSHSIEELDDNKLKQVEAHQSDKKKD